MHPDSEAEPPYEITTDNGTSCRKTDVAEGPIEYMQTQMVDSKRNEESEGLSQQYQRAADQIHICDSSIRENDVH